MVSKNISVFNFSCFQLSVYKTKIISPANHSRYEQCYNQSEFETNKTGAKRGKTRAGESQLVSALPLIGSQSGASFVSQS